jgi:hypothetical protein
MTTKEIKQLAENAWEGCQGCDENDKYFWMNGFMIGYLRAQVNNIDEQIKARHNNIADVLINNK